MLPRRDVWRSLFVPALLVVLLLAAGYAAYRLVDPLPPRRLTIAPGVPGSPFDGFAHQYAAILEQEGVQLGIHYTGSTVGNLDLLRDPGSGVAVAFATFGFTRPGDESTFYSLGGVYDAAVFVFHREEVPAVRLADLRGRRISVGPPGTALRAIMSEALRAAGAMDSLTTLSDLDYDAALDSLAEGGLDAAFFPSALDGALLQRALAMPGVRMMSVAQAEAIAKTVPGMRHVVLSRGLIDLRRDIPAEDVDLIALRSRVLVRRDLHPALQYLLLEAIRQVHAVQGPFNRLGEFPAEQPDDLPLSPTAQAFYRSGPTFWQRYTTFWLASLLSRAVFFVIPVLALLIPLASLAPRLYRWQRVRRIDRLHGALSRIEAEAPLGSTRVAEVERAMRSLGLGRGYEAELYRLREHLRMVKDLVARRAEEGP